MTRSAATMASWVLGLLLSLSGCSPTQTGEDSPTVPSSTPSQVRQPHGISFGDRAYDALWAKAGKALREGRTVAPAGNNAVEFYLQIRQGYPELRAPNAKPTPAQKALLDTLNRLGPDVSLAIDQAVARKDLGEASRLVRMLAAIDAENPSLERHIQQVEQATGKNKSKKANR